MEFKNLLNEHSLQFRVRYQETDQMGVVYHGNYFTYFEMGRTEHLRSAVGMSYRDLEASETLMVVAKAECSYRKPAKYDDILTLKTRVIRMTRFQIEHEYQLFRDQELLAVGHTILVTVDRSGKPIPGPSWMQKFSLSDSSNSNEQSDKNVV